MPRWIILFIIAESNSTVPLDKRCLSGWSILCRRLQGDEMTVKVSEPYTNWASGQSAPMYTLLPALLGRTKNLWFVNSRFRWNIGRRFFGGSKACLQVRPVQPCTMWGHWVADPLSFNRRRENHCSDARAAACNLIPATGQSSVVKRCHQLRAFSPRILSKISHISPAVGIYT